MRKAGLRILVAAAALTSPSCRGWAKLPDHTITVVAVKHLNLGDELTFTVTIKDGRGQALKKVAYEYRVDWVGAESSTHSGKSGILEVIRVQGQRGTATLVILGYDAKDNFGEIARHPFEVQ